MGRYKQYYYRPKSFHYNKYNDGFGEVIIVLLLLALAYYLAITLFYTLCGLVTFFVPVWMVYWGLKGLLYSSRHYLVSFLLLGLVTLGWILLIGIPFLPSTSLKGFLFQNYGDVFIDFFRLPILFLGKKVGWSSSVNVSFVLVRLYAWLPYFAVLVLFLVKASSYESFRKEVSFFRFSADLIKGTTFERLFFGIRRPRILFRTFTAFLQILFIVYLNSVFHLSDEVFYSLIMIVLVGGFYYYLDLWEIKKNVDEIHSLVKNEKKRQSKSNKRSISVSKSVERASKYIILENGKLQHRHIAEKVLKRKLKQTEVVHHINGKCDDNRENNLCVMNREKHEHFHAWLSWRKRKTGRYPVLKEQIRILQKDYGGIPLVY